MVVVTVAMLAVVFHPLLRDAALRPERSGPLQGRELAAAGLLRLPRCAEGRGGVANPGSQRATIPGFTGSTLMMYVRDEGEIRQYILDGRPDRLADDPEYRAEMAAQAIHMPAYRGTLSPGDVATCWPRSCGVVWMIEPAEEGPSGARGRAPDGLLRLPRRARHGRPRQPRLAEGIHPRVHGRRLPRSGRDDGELREWIRRGHLERIDRHPIGGWFARRQLVKMPAFEHFLTDDESAALVALVKWINGGGWQRTPLG